MTKAAITQAAIVRAIKAVEKAGVVIGAVHVTAEGTVQIIPADQARERDADGQHAAVRL